MKKTISFVCLVACTFIWGTTFIAQDTGMDNIGPFTFNSVRFFVGFLVVAPFVLLLEKKKVNAQIKPKINEFYKLIIPVGHFFYFWQLCFSKYLYFIQMWLILLFFTIFYVPMVPIIVYFLFSEKLHWSIWPSALACVIGGYFLSDISDANIRFGDGLVIIGALFWALHIIYIGKIIDQFDLPFFIAMLQNLVVATLSFLLVIIFEEIDFSLKSNWKQQKFYMRGFYREEPHLLYNFLVRENISAAPAAIVMSLEGVVAAVAAWIIFISNFRFK